MFVEDVIKDFAQRIAVDKDPLGQILSLDDWTKKFVLSLHGSVQGGRALSTKQASAFLNVVRRLKKSMGGPVGGFSEELLERFLASPRYRQQPYQSTAVAKEVRYLGDNKLGFRFPRIDEIMSDIKALSNRGRDATWKDFNRATFNRQFRMWVVPVTRDTYQSVMKIIGKHDFAYDDAVAEFLTLAENSKFQPSTFVLDPDTGKIVANICDNAILDSWVRRVRYGALL